MVAVLYVWLDDWVKIRARETECKERILDGFYPRFSYLRRREWYETNHW